MNTTETWSITLNTTEPSKIISYLTEKLDSSIETNNYKVNDNKITFNLLVKKNEEKKVPKLINNIITTYEITKYEYKKIEEVKNTEESDEL